MWSAVQQSRISDGRTSVSRGTHFCVPPTLVAFVSRSLALSHGAIAIQSGRWLIVGPVAWLRRRIGSYRKPMKLSIQMFVAAIWIKILVETTAGIDEGEASGVLIGNGTSTPPPAPLFLSITLALLKFIQGTMEYILQSALSVHASRISPIAARHARHPARLGHLCVCLIEMVFVEPWI